MSLDELIRQWFIRNEQIAGRMALYAGDLAIFLQAAPSDVQHGWDNKTQYPRIVNTVELRADSERKSQGILRVDLYCDLAETAPEEIEPLIRSSLKDIVMQPDDGSPYCFAWQRTDAFELESKNADKRIAGYELTFDILEFPDQYTTYPDPIESMSLGLKEAFPDMFVIGVDKIERFRIATEDEPIIYCRMESIENDHTSMALAWINCRIAIHVIAPSADARSKLVRVIMNCLMMSGEAVMTDGTPLRFTGTRAANTSDYLTNGQIMLSGQYTLPRTIFQDGNLLRNAHTRLLKEVPNEQERERDD